MYPWCQHVIQQCTSTHSMLSLHFLFLTLPEVSVLTDAFEPIRDTDWLTWTYVPCEKNKTNKGVKFIYLLHILHLCSSFNFHLNCSYHLSLSLGPLRSSNPCPLCLFQSNLPPPPLSLFVTATLFFLILFLMECEWVRHCSCKFEMSWPFPS